MHQDQRLFLVYQKVDELLYGAISTLREEDLQQGGTIALEWSYPYIVSKHLGDREIVYGSVIHLMYEAARPILRMNALLKEMGESLPDETRSSLVITRSHGAITHTSPSKGFSASFLHKQEEIMKDALLLSGLHLRTLLEMFSGRGNAPVPLYDYEGNSIGTVSLAVLFNTLMHYRYCVIYGEYVHDLFSRTSQLESPRLFGSKIKTAELFKAVVTFITAIRMNDFVGMLRRSLKGLAVDSEPREIAFAVQNVHSLNQIISDRILEPQFQGFQQFLCRELTEDEKIKIKESDGKSEVRLERRFGKPSFKIGDDPGAAAIDMHININGKSECFEFSQAEFFGELSQALGDEPLETLDRLVERFDKLAGSDC